MTAGLLLALFALQPAQAAWPPTTDIPLDARYEIVQPQGASQPFRLDRYTGQLAQLSRGNADNWLWTDVEVLGLPQVDEASRPRFQIVSSASGLARVFLIDTQTGQTWVSREGQRRAADGTLLAIPYWAPLSN